MTLIAIDPGLTGAAAALNPDGTFRTLSEALMIAHWAQRHMRAAAA